ncbi:hypothetical protein [Qipengyuania profunda]|jgi:hypothetical protein|nr:hypothetical protein [Qipengyuania sp. HL-TH1]WPL57928.1 hypothetical protein SD421_05705 [Qipengyuania sp. HL-TH5]
MLVSPTRIRSTATGADGSRGTVDDADTDQNAPTIAKADGA